MRNRLPKNSGTTMKKYFRCLAATIRKTKLMAGGVLTAASVALVLILAGCGGGSGGESDGSTGPGPTPEPTVTPTLMPTPTATPTPAPQPRPDTSANPSLPEKTSADWHVAADASRLLQQATFGATAKSINRVVDIGTEAWIDEQMALPQTMHLDLLLRRYEEIGLVPAPATDDAEEGWVRDLQRSDIWWEAAVWGEDQLRQRIAYSLSQILVISNVSDVLYNDSRGIAHYHDILASHAFGDYRELLEAVTLNPMMGEYLSMVRNEKSDPSRNIRPDENYARELMQLFSIGLVELNLDGTVKLDASGDPIPTYDQDDIKALARVFTGWNMATINQWWEWVEAGQSEVLPMKAFEAYHDTDEKILFDDYVIPAGQSARQDLEDALDIIFNHPNLAPFIGRQLIQRLVTSNPSPAYVQRVATVFNDNGNGERGDLGAVVLAILLDDEARNGHTQSDNFGKPREPLLKFSALWRAFRAQGVRTSHDGQITDPRLRFRGSDREIAQRPFGSFSVFNFYRPDYSQTGEIKDAGMFSPEFQILTESAIITQTNRLSGSIFWREMNRTASETPFEFEWDVYPPRLNLTEEMAMITDRATLLDRLDLLLMAGQMSDAMYNEVLAYMNSQPLDHDYHREMLTYETIFLVMASPEYAVQK